MVDEDVYQRQGDNIITWCEAPPLTGSPNGAGSGGGVDLALSFQVKRGRDEVGGRGGVMWRGREGIQ